MAGARAFYAEAFASAHPVIPRLQPAVEQLGYTV